MSIVINNGFKINTTDLNIIQEICKLICFTIQDIGKQLFLKRSLELISEILDRQYLFNTKEENLKLFEELNEFNLDIFSNKDIKLVLECLYKDFKFSDKCYTFRLLQQLVNNCEQHNDLKTFDLRCYVKIATVNNKTLIMINSYQSEYLDVIYKHIESIVYNNIGLEPYIYWDNCDKPNNISDKLWEQCTKDWQLALEENNWFKKQIYSIETKTCLEVSKELTNHLKSIKEKRIKDLVDEIAFSKKTLKELSNIREYTKYRKTDEFKNDIQKITQILNTYLPDTYSEEKCSYIQLD